MNRIIGQIIRFVGLSGIGWILDFCTYAALGLVSANYVINNVVSSWIGVSFVFVFATRKIFENNSKISLKWKYLIYLGYQVVLIFVVSKLLGMINNAIIDSIKLEFVLRFSSIISKILVTPITLILNFFVMKGVIEKI